MRAILKPFVIHAAYSPIETIVFFSIVGTLAYFHVLSAIKHSAFFAPSYPNLPPRPSYVLLRGGEEWVSVREAFWHHAKAKYAASPDEVDIVPVELVSVDYETNKETLTQSILNLTKHLPEYTSSCYRPLSLEPAGCFTDELSRPKAIHQTLAFSGQQNSESIGEMKSSKWVAYAASALVTRFWDLAKKADSLDIVLILAGYILMHTTFLLLFYRSRRLGSNFWLPSAIFISSVFALLLSLPIAMLLKIPMDPVALTEALPFLVCTVGFDKPLRLARAVFSHPQMHPLSSTTSMPPKPAGEIVLEALSNVYTPIFRDYVLEIAVLLGGAYSRVSGLREVCALAALVLGMDCLLLCTFLSSILCIMVEVRRIQSIRGATTPTKTTSTPNTPTESQSLGRKISSLVLGEKGSSLPTGNTFKSKGVENPVGRLKLILIATFLGLHTLNFITPLTPQRSSSHSSISLPSTSLRKVDPSTPAIQHALAALADTERISGTEHTEKEVRESGLVVKINPAIHVRASHLSLSPPHSLASSNPVLSKWIVMVLAVSISLNGYLLKGIAAAANNTSAGGKVREQEGVVGDKVEEPVRPVQPAPAPAPISVPRRPPTFTLDEVDRRLKAQKKSSPLASSSSSSSSDSDLDNSDSLPVRPLEELVSIYDNGPRPTSLTLSLLNDEEVILLSQNGKIAAYALEKELGNTKEGFERAVRVRRALISRASKTQTLEHSLVPMTNYDYSLVHGACCENVVGYIPLPLGIAGPLKVDGHLFPIPMATAEGTLVASTSRGCKALNAGGGVTTVLTQDAMTRGPAIDFPSVVEAAKCKAWIDSAEGYGVIKVAFESTSRFAKLRSLKCAMAGRTLFVRFATATGDAMGMNMISKGTEKALEVLQQHFPDMITLALSGNYCTDKKPAAINWIEGRGKSVVAEAVVPGKIVKSVLKTTVEALVNLNTKKNLVGVRWRGVLGDPAQNVESSNCMTLMEPTNNGQDLLITITMPSIEVGTVGAVPSSHPNKPSSKCSVSKAHILPTPGQNAQSLARMIAAAVMAGELSLMSALAAGHLVRAHLVHNRSQVGTPAVGTPNPGNLSAGMTMSSLTPSASTGSLPPYKP
ncbi:hypothetical protein BT96DRAFT_958205 [Gymnopus androsaceus JB14]|uniref:hydroxymethylglutaryl-CoA reductase (NADPH) n=1 Tax=Gymnopus androsaceus JB14 TaxID=1447944 RepID=A0A6A4HH70_9AGAR|nr:hypothetical protein BT96DRAFT_958205 [Gymnopus androsaceus JB14]